MTAGERFAESEHSVTRFKTKGYKGHRAPLAAFGWVECSKSPDTEAVQKIADSMATITETAVIHEDLAYDGRICRYRVDFLVTHRIVPARATVARRLLRDVSDQEYADLVNGRTTLRALGVSE